MGRVSCKDCKQCNRKGRPSVTRLSKYCDNHFVHRVKVEKSNVGFFTNLKNKFFDNRAKYDEKGRLVEFKNKGFRRDWFWR